MKMKILKSLGLIKSQSLDEILSTILCNPKSKKCSYGECSTCEKKSLEFNLDKKNGNNGVCKHMNIMIIMKNYKKNL